MNIFFSFKCHTFFFVCRHDFCNNFGSLIFVTFTSKINKILHPYRLFSFCSNFEIIWNVAPPILRLLLQRGVTLVNACSILQYHLFCFPYNINGIIKYFKSSIFLPFNIMLFTNLVICES